jgi:hypothetical protein
MMLMLSAMAATLIIVFSRAVVSNVWLPFLTETAIFPRVRWHDNVGK